MRHSIIIQQSNATVQPLDYVTKVCGFNRYVVVLKN